MEDGNTFSLKTRDSGEVSCPALLVGDSSNIWACLQRDVVNCMSGCVSKRRGSGFENSSVICSLEFVGDG